MQLVRVGSKVTGLQLEVEVARQQILQAGHDSLKQSVALKDQRSIDSLSRAECMFGRGLKNSWCGGLVPEFTIIGRDEAHNCECL